MEKPLLILTPCGTSLLTNCYREKTGIIYKYANKQSREDIERVSKEDLKIIDYTLEMARKKLLSGSEGASYEEARRLSAEINGILGIYGGYIPKRKDYHWLLSTDTYLGRETAKMIEEWLRLKSENISVNRTSQKDLQTENLIYFQSSLVDLIKTFEEQIPKYREKYKIIFNLTAGFKAIQGFLQSIFHFYADEAVYIFEKSEELMRIPRLPIKLDTENEVKSHLKIFRRLSKGLPVDDFGDFPEIFLFRIDDQHSLSVWGEIVWKRTKDKIYQEDIWDSPSGKIKFSKHFLSTVKNLPPDRCKILNEQIDDLARFIETGKHNISSLSFKSLKGKPKKISTHEFYAWSDGDAERVFCHFDEKGNLILDELGEHL